MSAWQGARAALDQRKKHELLVVELEHTVSCLASPRLDLSLNRPGHGLAFGELVEILQGLHGRGLISFTRGGTEVPGIGADGIVEALRSTHDFQHIERSLYFGMTSLGGACWERAAGPDWSRFVDEGYRLDPRVGHLRGLDREYVEQLGARVGERIAGTDQWPLLRPWRATYWKTLPSGHELRFRYERSPWRVTPSPWRGGDEAVWFRPASPPAR